MIFSLLPLTNAWNCSESSMKSEYIGVVIPSIPAKNPPRVSTTVTTPLNTLMGIEEEDDDEVVVDVLSTI